MGKVTVREIRKLQVGEKLKVIMPTRLACVSLRNLVSYVNLCYPVEGYRYRTNITRDNTITVYLEERKEKK